MKFILNKTLGINEIDGISFKKIIEILGRASKIKLELGKDNFDLNIINMFRLTNQNIPHPKMNEITCTVGYNYRF